MRINKRVHPAWLEHAKIILIVLGTDFVLIGLISWPLSDNMILEMLFNTNILLTAAKYLCIAGGGMAMIGIGAVSVEHWLCRAYCIGWENHNLTR